MMLACLLNLLQWWSKFCLSYVIGGSDDPYMTRWFLIPRNRFFNIYLHRFHRSDDDRAMHDHPWWSISLLLSGACVEHDLNGFKAIKPGQIRIRSAEYRHRIELVGTEVWTLFLTGPRLREWGFWCPQGWVSWKIFTTGEHGETTGIGCG